MPTVYFVTFVTDTRFPFLDEDLFVNTLIDTSVMACRLKKCRILGYKINPEDVHVLIEKRANFLLENIMHSIKRNSSSNINKLIRAPARLPEHDTIIMGMRIRKCCRNMDMQNIHEFPLFKWKRGLNSTLIYYLFSQS